MDIALCYESVLPARGGCEMYITDLARRLATDGHAVHLYAAHWDAAALSDSLHYHRLPAPSGPRALRPWQFGAACVRALRGAGHQVSVGFNKTWGQDVLYPQAGLHVASAEHNVRKHGGTSARGLARLTKRLDVAHWSFSRLERRQYLGTERPVLIANSRLVQGHFQHYYGIPPEQVRVVHSAIDPGRFSEEDRPRRRVDWRRRWKIGLEETVGLFVATNYHLKGLEPLLHAMRQLPERPSLRLLVAGSPRTAWYERLARRLGIANRVCFAGFCADTRNCYFASDFLVHPTFYDPCSLVVLEARACGLPVITSRFNGASELMSPPDDGYVMDDPHDHRRLAWCLGQLLEPARRSACAHAARQSSARWTFERHYRQLLGIFAEVAARKAPAVVKALESPARRSCDRAS
jgi:UDP-glucose:(heptosyl)LPS alpha-1,3-glucosyltransferase